ncbi:AbrB family transcriptional regulator [Polymorphum gilvum]|uniref:Ammonia monooxygenase, putative n=1 Tax=Polymorphum gilvum (strain LMG 25793 / CGMCC 1.9160 / SL003B-26A1) TaxID=991905 RepID=F2IZI7_POLGS|nr:AbrB family transcriptional regulator [Polymorphum gilvum]ADZ69544.1 Ammonia monooxygenase, putative [Polymorphum gilvum SL003B-26A1]
MLPVSSLAAVRTPLATLAVAASGGAVAAWIGAPLPWLIGAQVSLCLLALSGRQLFGAPPSWPRSSRQIFLPILGLMISNAFTSEILRQIPDWWSSLLLLSVFLVLVHAAVFLLFLKFGRYDLPTAFFASFPGGFVEATLLGTERGGNQRLILIQHFLRISLIVLIIPLVFWWFGGQVVGSMVQSDLVGPRTPLSVSDVIVLAGAGIGGTLFARRLRLPAADISGAILFGAIVHLVGWTDGTPPAVLIAVTQLVVGTSLGVGFVGIAARDLVQALGLALAAFALMMTMAVLAAFGLHGLLGMRFEALLLAFAPGGLAEMSLIALSLHLSVPFVTLHHLYRIFFAVAVLPQAYRFVERTRSGAP